MRRAPRVRSVVRGVATVWLLTLASVPAMVSCRTREAPAAVVSRQDAPDEIVDVPAAREGDVAPVDAAPAGAKQGGKPEVEQPVATLATEYRSERELAEAVLRAVAANDAEALGRLRVGRTEYLDLLWPEFPQAKDPRHTLAPEFHWNLLDSSSAAGIRDVLADFGGSDFELLEVRPSAGVVEYDTFRLLRKFELRVRRRPDGREGVLRILGSIVERGGRYKLLSYPS